MNQRHSRLLLDKHSYDVVRELLSDRPVSFHPYLAKRVGGATAGLFLCQLLYWSDKGADPDGWIYKTQAEWTNETALTRPEQETARKRLKEHGVLEEHHARLDHRMYYRVRWDTLLALLHQADDPPPIPESGNPALPNAGGGEPQFPHSPMRESSIRERGKPALDESGNPAMAKEGKPHSFNEQRLQTESSGAESTPRRPSRLPPAGVSREGADGADAPLSLALLEPYGKGFEILKTIPTYSPNPALDLKLAGQLVEMDLEPEAFLRAMAAMSDRWPLGGRKYADPWKAAYNFALKQPAIDALSKQPHTNGVSSLVPDDDKHLKDYHRRWGHGSPPEAEAERLEA